MMHGAVLLVIRRSWVRAPPAPPAVFLILLVEPWIGSGHIEQLPSGSWRAKVYAGKDPLTGREIRFRKTCKCELAAQIELGKLLALAQAGRQPDSGPTAQRAIALGS